MLSNNAIKMRIGSLGRHIVTFQITATSVGAVFLNFKSVLLDDTFYKFRSIFILIALYLPQDN